MQRISIFDQPRCRPTGIGGTLVDQAIVAFAAAFDWLQGKGAEIERHDP